MGIRPVWPHSTRQNSVGIQASIQQIFDRSQRTLRRTYVINSYMVYKMSFKFFYEGVNRAFKKIDAINQLSIQGYLGLKSKPSIECRPETAKELCQSPIMASYLILGTSYLQDNRNAPLDRAHFHNSVVTNITSGGIS